MDNEWTCEPDRLTFESLGELSVGFKIFFLWKKIQVFEKLTLDL